MGFNSALKGLIF